MSVLLVLVLVCLGAWWLTEGSVSVSRIASPRVESFYWATILTSNTLGTALGDFMADDGGLGYEGGALVFGALGCAAWHRRRPVAIVFASVVGLVVSLVFIRFSAPDLALTQLSVEVVTIVLLLLSLRFLPEAAAPRRRPGRATADAVLAIAGGKLVLA